jgi:hypothetical protein
VVRGYWLVTSVARNRCERLRLATDGLLEERILRGRDSPRATKGGKHDKAEREGEKARKTTVQ